MGKSKGTSKGLQGLVQNENKMSCSAHRRSLATQLAEPAGLVEYPKASLDLWVDIVLTM